MAKRKLKTVKAISKRIKTTGAKRLITQASGQNHFNARERGNTTRNKRRNNKVAKVNERNVRRAIQVY